MRHLEVAREETNKDIGQFPTGKDSRVGGTQETLPSARLAKVAQPPGSRLQVHTGS